MYLNALRILEYNLWKTPRSSEIWPTDLSIIIRHASQHLLPCLESSTCARYSDGFHRASTYSTGLRCRTQRIRAHAQWRVIVTWTGLQKSGDVGGGGGGGGGGQGGLAPPPLAEGMGPGPLSFLKVERRYESSAVPPTSAVSYPCTNIRKIVNNSVKQPKNQL